MQCRCTQCNPHLPAPMASWVQETEREREREREEREERGKKIIALARYYQGRCTNNTNTYKYKHAHCSIKSLALFFLLLWCSDPLSLTWDQWCRSRDGLPGQTHTAAQNGLEARALRIKIYLAPWYFSLLFTSQGATYSSTMTPYSTRKSGGEEETCIENYRIGNNRAGKAFQQEWE